MSEIDIVRAWRDEDYRLSLSDQDRAAVPESPAGVVDLSDLDLEGVAGGSVHFGTLGCCGGLTTDYGLCSIKCTDICTIICSIGQFCPV
jgi:mersacidin/lichenicidin family type 2 lantibiotic